MYSIYKIFKKYRHKKRICKLNDIQIHRSVNFVKTMHIDGKNNKIIINDDVKFEAEIWVLGSNNLIEISKGATVKGKLQIFGNNNHIKIDCNTYIKVNLSMGFSHADTICNGRFTVGNKTVISGITINLLENKSEVIIGNNVIISYDVMIWGSDTHAILNQQKEVINFGKRVCIEDNCWVGYGVLFTKNSSIASGSIVGMGAVVTKFFKEPNVCIAGNPAKIIKHNVLFDRADPDSYKIKQTQEKQNG